ncbi:beta-1,4-galactosyltransferase 4-like, partial [Ruditapes philippinarum]|uniref:beta-1,4-galactosyltransferase 4-like n=1 Tax=Ruditapes philippinarum TaxID=129788 RepID=UPI00295BBCCF
MTSVCQTQINSIEERNDIWNSRKLENCSVKQKTVHTTDTPAYNYTTYRNSSNGNFSLKLVWPEKQNLAICKIKPKLLAGRIEMSSSVTAKDVMNAKAIAKVKYGGVYRPPDCRSSQNVAVIIPYRDRPDQLKILVNHLHNMLQRQRVFYGIYVVEMALPVQFNRGILANVGFLTAGSIVNYTCYIIHDVDLVPINDNNLYRCSEYGPKHMVTQNSAFENGKLPYSGYVGGVIAFTTLQYAKINGFSNLYFGWGGEDDDMFKRIRARNMTLQRPPDHIGVFRALKHTQDSSNPPNPHREMLLNQAAYRIDIDGMSSINYNRKSLEFRTLYTWILVDCIEAELLEMYPFLRADSKLMSKKVKQKRHHLTVIQSKDGEIREN